MHCFHEVGFVCLVRFGKRSFVECNFQLILCLALTFGTRLAGAWSSGYGMILTI